MAVAGVVELLHRKRIDGWAFDSETKNSPVLDLCIEGLPLKRVKALRRRPGFDDLVTNGIVGFRFKIHPSLLAYVRSREAVTMRLNGYDLPVVSNRLRLLPEAQRRDPAEIPELLAGQHIITKQGEIRLSVRYDVDWQTRYFSFYEEARDRFRAMFGYDLFVSFGALLGYTRDGVLILTDDDLDTSYVSRHTDPAKVRQEFIDIHRALRDAGEYSKISPRRRTFLKWKQRSGRALIDVFPAFTWGKHFFMSPGVGVENGAWIAAKGVKTVTWYNHKILVPVASEEVLAAAYGPGWGVYDPLFQWIIPRYARRGMRRIQLLPAEAAALNRYPISGASQ